MIQMTRTEALRALLDRLQKEYRNEVTAASIFRMTVRTGEDGKTQAVLVRETDIDKMARIQRVLVPRIDRLTRLVEKAQETWGWGWTWMSP